MLGEIKFFLFLFLDEAVLSTKQNAMLLFFLDIPKSPPPFFKIFCSIISVWPPPTPKKALQIIITATLAFSLYPL